MTTFRMLYFLFLLIVIILTVVITIKHRKEVVRTRLYWAMYFCGLFFFLVSYVINSIRIEKWGDWNLISSLLLLRDIEKGALYGIHKLGYIFLAVAITGSLCAVFNKKDKD